MKNFRNILLLFLSNAILLCHANNYEIDQEEFKDYIDHSSFKVWTYDEVLKNNYSVSVPPAGPHSSAFYLTDYVQPQYTDRYKVPATGDVTFQATFYCDNSISEFEVRFSYPWQDHFFVMCGPSSGSAHSQWQTKTKSFSCVSAQGCTEIELWIYGITVGPGNVIGLQNLKFITGDSTFPPTESTTPHSDLTTTPMASSTPITSSTPGISTTAGPTTTPKTTTTRPPGEGLECYSCIGCNYVDRNTPTIQLDDFNLCVTTFFGGTQSNMRSMVVRGGSSENHVDGECLMHDGMMDCFCAASLCNNQNVTSSTF